MRQCQQTVTQAEVQCSSWLTFAVTRKVSNMKRFKMAQFSVSSAHCCTIIMNTWKLVSTSLAWCSVQRCSETRLCCGWVIVWTCLVSKLLLFHGPAVDGWNRGSHQLDCISEGKAPNALDVIEQRWVSGQKVTANASSDHNLNLVIITLHKLP